jgi:hypothetical protein
MCTVCSIDVQQNNLYSQILKCLDCQCVVCAVFHGVRTFPKGIRSLFLEKNNRQHDHERISSSEGRCKVCGKCSSATQFTASSLYAYSVVSSLMQTCKSAAPRALARNTACLLSVPCIPVHLTHTSNSLLPVRVI